MRRRLCQLLPAVVLLTVPVAASAEVSVGSTTVMRLQESHQPGFDNRFLAPATEFLRLDLEKLGGDNLSAHFYGWGQLEFADHDGNDTRSDGNLTYGYLQYRFNAANAQVRAGRFFVSEGVVNEQVDGVSARTDLPHGFAVSAFGGAPVHTVSMPTAATDGKGNGIFGGRASYRAGGKYEFGLSGVYESEAPALKSTLPVAGSYGSHRLAGWDLWLAPHRMVQLIGHSSYNTQTGGFAEHSYLLLARPLKELGLDLSFDQHNDREYFYSSPLFAGMLQKLGQDSLSVGGSATYSFSRVEASADYKHYRREIGSADRFGAELRGNFQDNTLRTGAGYHYTRADGKFAIVPGSGSSGSFHELRGFALRDGKRWFGSVDLIGFFFKDRIDGKETAWEATGSIGYRPAPALALSGDLQYGQNPRYENEVKGLIRLTYNLDTAKGGAK